MPGSKSETFRNNCPNCGNPNRKEAIFCKSCGSHLRAKDNLHQSSEQTEDGEDFVYEACPVCGDQKRKEAPFCHQCGKASFRGVEFSPDVGSSLLLFEYQTCVNLALKETSLDLEGAKNLDIKDVSISNVSVEESGVKFTDSDGRLVSYLLKDRFEEYITARAGKGAVVFIPDNDNLLYRGEIKNGHYACHFYDDVRQTIIRVIGRPDEVKQRLLQQYEQQNHKIQEGVKATERDGRSFSFGAVTLASPEHSNEDRLGYKKFPGTHQDRNRFMVIDGSGGSLDETRIPVGQRSAVIGRKMEKILDLMEQKNISASKAIELVDKEVKNEPGYGTIVVADIIEPKNLQGEQKQSRVEIAWMGDAAALRWNHEPQYYDRQRYFDKHPGKATSFQLLNEPHNLGMRLKQAGSELGPDTGRLDEDGRANSIYRDIGDGEGKADTLILTEDQVDADFLLLVSDGAQPSTLSARDLTEKRKVNYKRNVNSILLKLYRGEMTMNQAADKICREARTTLGDSDDISVMIIDTRRLGRASR